MVDRLIGMGHEVRVLVSGFRSQTHPNLVNSEAEVYAGDLRKYDTLYGVTRGVDFVYHLGGILSHYCELYPESTIDVNVKGTWNLREACLKNGVERLIFASSSYVYGEPVENPVGEDAPLRPKELFGVSKLAAEKILQTVHPHKLPYTILRLFNVYGSRCYTDGVYTAVIPTFIEKALKGEALTVHGDGSQKLDYVYVGDVADAFVKCLHENATDQVFNVGTGVATNVNELATLINDLASNGAGVVYDGSHPPYLRRVQAGITKIMEKLGWSPQTGLEKGLAETVEWHRKEVESKLNRT